MYWGTVRFLRHAMSWMCFKSKKAHQSLTGRPLLTVSRNIIQRV